MISMWRRVISVRSQGAASSGADCVAPELEPTELEVDVKFPPPRVIRVPSNFQTVCV